MKRLWGVYENIVVVSLITQARLLNLGNDFKAGGWKQHAILLRTCCVVSQTHLKEHVQKFITGPLGGNTVKFTDADLVPKNRSW